MNAQANVVAFDANKVPALQMAEGELLKVLKSSLYPGAADESIKMVLGYCKAAGYDPMQKPVHIVPMWDNKTSSMRDVIMPGVGLYRTQAARTGQFAGMTEPEFGPDVTEVLGGISVTYPQWCRVTVKRLLASGQIAEFTAREFWKENYAIKGGKEKSVAPNAMWMRRVYGQLAKCAQAQALRLAFPEAIGADATAEELDGKELNDAQPQPTISATVEAARTTLWSEQDFDRNFPKWSEVIATGRKSADTIIEFASQKHQFTAEQEAKLRAVKLAGDPPEAQGEQQ